VEKYKKEVI